MKMACSEHRRPQILLCGKGNGGRSKKGRLYQFLTVLGLIYTANACYAGVTTIQQPDTIVLNGDVVIEGSVFAEPGPAVQEDLMVSYVMMLDNKVAGTSSVVTPKCELTTSNGVQVDSIYNAGWTGSMASIRYTLNIPESKSKLQIGTMRCTNYTNMTIKGPESKKLSLALKGNIIPNYGGPSRTANIESVKVTAKNNTYVIQGWDGSIQVPIDQIGQIVRGGRVVAEYVDSVDTNVGGNGLVDVGLVKLTTSDWSQGASYCASVKTPSGGLEKYTVALINNRTVQWDQCIDQTTNSDVSLRTLRVPAGQKITGDVVVELRIK